MKQSRWFGLGACVLAGCGGATQVSGGDAVVEAPHSLGEPLAAVLPPELPLEPRCLGFSPDGNGALVVSPFAPTGQPEQPTGARLQFVMLAGFEPPVLGTLDFDASDPDEYAARRAELEPQLVALGLAPCETLAHGYSVNVPHGHGDVNVGESWQDVTADASEAYENGELTWEQVEALGPDRAGVVLLRRGPRNFVSVNLRWSVLGRGPHQKFESIYYNPWATAVVIAVSNDDGEDHRWEAYALDGGGFHPRS